jgi:chromate transporter
MAAFLDTVNIVSVAIILAICVEMGREAITGWRTIAIALLSFFVILVFRKINTAFIILGGAVTGWLLWLIP